MGPLRWCWPLRPPLISGHDPATHATDRRRAPVRRPPLTAAAAAAAVQTHHDEIDPLGGAVAGLHPGVLRGQPEAIPAQPVAQAPPAQPVTQAALAQRWPFKFAQTATAQPVAHAGAHFVVSVDPHFVVDACSYGSEHHGMQAAWKKVGSAAFLGSSVWFISLALHPKTGMPYVAYSDYEDPHSDNFLAVITYNGSTWNTLGSANVSASKASYVSLALHPTTFAPFVAFMDHNNSQKATVMTFNGGKWSPVGNAGFSVDWAFFTSLAMHPTTYAPYVAFMDYGKDLAGQATVMTFNGKAWVNVGSPGFSAGPAEFIFLAMHPSTGAPFVAYSDHGNSQKATVMTFNGKQWLTVGHAGFSAGRADSISLAIHPTTYALYVAYSDFANSNKTTVMTFNGAGQWVTVGPSAISAGAVDGSMTSLAIHPTTAQPYVAYVDSKKATVMKFNGSAWSPVGSPGFSAGEAYMSSTGLALQPRTGVPYFAYIDGDIGGNSFVLAVATFQ